MTAKLEITAIIPNPLWVGIRNEMLVMVETDRSIVGYRTVTNR
jgi:galactonate dehydratase